MSRFLSIFGLSLLVIFVLQNSALQAQDATNCSAVQTGEPARIVYDCANGLLIEAESYADLQSLAALDQSDPKTLEVKERAVLIKLTPGNGPFQIRTPHAIASVRGTEFYVDAQTLQTAVFVVDGIVAVERTDGTDQIELKAGEGVTITAGEPVVVKVWPAEKVAALLARFGR